MIIIFDNKYENMIRNHFFLIIKLIKKRKKGKKEIIFLIINLVAFQNACFLFLLV
jgi:hypothetical protein